MIYFMAPLCIIKLRFRCDRGFSNQISKYLEVLLVEYYSKRVLSSDGNHAYDYWMLWVLFNTA
jgi:hypothetical protein